jgi:hypothetical protein
VLRLAGLLLLAAISETPHPIEVGDPLPAFEADGWLNAKDPITPETLQGKVAVVAIWGTWAAGSQTVLAHLATLQAKQGTKIQTLGLETTGAGGMPVDKFVSDRKVTIPIGYGKAIDDLVTELGTRGVHSIPTVFVIGADGRIAWMGGSLQMDRLDRAVDKALSPAAAASKKK